MENIVIGSGGGLPVTDKDALLKLLGIVEMPSVLELNLVVAYSDGREEQVARLKLQAHRGINDDGTPNVKCVMRLQSILAAMMQTTAGDDAPCQSTTEKTQAVTGSEQSKRLKNENAAMPPRVKRPQAKQPAAPKPRQGEKPRSTGSKSKRT